MLREVGCRLPAQSARLRARQPQRRGHRRPVRAAQFARMRAQQPTCQIGHVIGVQAQSAHLRARQPHRSRQSAACHQHNPRVCAHSNLRANSAMSSALKHNPHACIRGNVGLRRFRHHGCSTIHALARGNRTSPANPLLGISTIRAYARSNTSCSSMMPAVMRYGPHTCTRDNSQRCFPRLSLATRLRLPTAQQPRHPNTSRA